MLGGTPSRSRSGISQKRPLEYSYSQQSQDSDDVSCIHSLHRRVPATKKITEKVRKIPPKYRWGCVMLWILWKFVFVFLIYAFFRGHVWSANQLGDGRPRILYIVTSLAEYNNGKRETKKDQDRLAEVVMPVVKANVESLVKDYNVDVYFILAYELRPERKVFIESHFPEGVGFEVWDDACPFGYDSKKNKFEGHLLDNTRTLARQHRYVVKDKLPAYDVFMAFEDDMRVTNEHVSQYLSVSRDIDRLRVNAPSSLPGLVPESSDPMKQRFDGPMTRGQLDRLIPGFVRVEVLLNRTANPSQSKLDPVSPDHSWDGMYQLDPAPCCHVSLDPNPDNIPSQPPMEDVVVWETTIEPMSVRKLPPLDNGLDWITLLPGPGKKLSEDLAIGGYWSGRQGAYPEKVSTAKPYFLAQQGGWMATREQIIRWNSEICMGSLLPPFDAPSFSEDGQSSFNVEFWSGGYQLFTGIKAGCNLQRIVDLRHASDHFLYHVANNKQRQISRHRLVKANDLVGQWNAVRKMAESTNSKAETS